MLHKITSAGIEITNKCNLHCIHCYEGDLKCDLSVPVSNIENIIHKVLPYDPKYFVITGGEPFMHECILDILETLGEDFPNVSFRIATNGTLIRDEHIRILKKYDNINVQISLDGATKETHEKQHGKGTFESVVDTIKKLTVIKKSKVSLLMSISKINYLECVEVAEFARSIGVNVSFQFVCSVGRAEKNKETLQMSAFQQTSTYLRLNTYSKQHPEMQIVAPKTLLTCSFLLDDTPLAFNVNLYGDIVTCTCFDSRYSLGNIYKQSVSEILNSPVLEIIHRQVLERKRLLSDTVCKKCIVNSRCGQGCIGRAIQRGNMYGLDGECDFRRSLMIVNNAVNIAKNR